MPTLPSSGATPPHRHRGTAESFGVDAERYERARPRYPDSLVRRVVADAPGPDVLDVGCGTGIAARQFHEAGCRVLGVEPDGRMAQLARRFGVETEESTFEAWDPDGRAFDAVVAAQAWHWIDPVEGAVKAARVLRPRGRFAAFWNVFQLPPELSEAFNATYQRVVPEAPVRLPATPEQALTAYEAMFQQTADGLYESGGFREPEEWRFDWELYCTRQSWLDQLPTTGLLTRLQPWQQAQILEGAGAAVDFIGGSFTMRFVTGAVTAVRAGRR